MEDDESVPYAQYQLRHVKLRGDARAQEADAQADRHPWLTLGEERAWQCRRLLLAVLVTHALDRKKDDQFNHFLKKIAPVDSAGKPYRPVCRETRKPEDSYADIQNLWTFSRKHFDDQTDWMNVASLQDAKQRTRISSAIIEHL